MKLIDADALKQDLISRGFYPVIVKNAIDAAPEILLEEQILSNFEVITKDVNSFAKWFVELSTTKSIDGDNTYYYALGSSMSNKWTEDKEEALEYTKQYLRRSSINERKAD